MPFPEFDEVYDRESYARRLEVVARACYIAGPMNFPDRAETLIHASAAHCFEQFCDVKHLPRWVPGLERAKVVRVRADGLPLEVLYEHATLSYSVLYDYDVMARRVTWEPGMGRRDSVRGFVEFTDDGDRCRMSYAVEAMNGRLRPNEAERFVAAFTKWVEETPRASRGL